LQRGRENLKDYNRCFPGHTETPNGGIYYAISIWLHRMPISAQNLPGAEE